MFNKIKIVLLSLFFSSYSLATGSFEQYENTNLPSNYKNLKVEIKKNNDRKYYSIENVDVNELGNRILSSAPISNDDFRSISKLSFSLNWQPNSVQSDYCILESVEIISESVFNSPLWKYDETVSEHHKEQWNNFIEALSNYMSRNQNIIDKHVNALKTKIENIKPEKNCSTISEKIDSMGFEELELLSKEIRAFQSETNNGQYAKNMEYPDFYSEQNENKEVQQVKPND